MDLIYSSWTQKSAFFYEKHVLKKQRSQGVL